MQNDPKNKSAAEWYDLGRSAQKKGNLKAALKAYKESARSDARFRPAFVRLGEIYSKAKHPDLAIGFFQRALEIQPDATVLFNLGSESYRLNRIDKSIQYLKAALKLDRKLIKAHLLLAFLYRTQKQSDKAIVYFQNARKLDPQNRMAYLGEAIALAEQKKYINARDLILSYNQKINANDTPFHELLAGIQLQLGDSEASYKQYKQLTKKSEKFTSFTDHLNRARDAADSAFKESFKGLDKKIDQKFLKLKERIQARKKLLSGKPDLSARQNGIEGAQDLQQELKEDLTDMVDLSLMHLFNGDSDKAMQFLFQAHKMGNENQKK